MNIKARAVKQIEQFDELYGSAWRRIRKSMSMTITTTRNIQKSSLSAYLNLRFTFESDRSVGITLEGMEVGSVIAALHDLAVKKSMIPSIQPTRRAILDGIRVIQDHAER